MGKGKIAIKLFLSILLLSLSLNAQSAFGIVYGRVTGNGMPVSGARIESITLPMCMPRSGYAMTNQFGLYSMSVNVDCALLLTAAWKDREFVNNPRILSPGGSLRQDWEIITTLWQR